MASIFTCTHNLKPKAYQSKNKSMERRDSLNDLEAQMSDATKLIESEAGTCCIYAVPETLIDINGKGVYHPRVVSIGPYHRGENQVEAMKKHKQQFLSLLLERKQLILKDLLERESIRSLETKARECYATKINLKSMKHSDKSKETSFESIKGDTFLKLMVLDGCFLIELFRKANEKKLFEPDDSLATMAWAIPYIYGDLLLLENQIPFFVLDSLFKTFKMHEECNASLSLLALRFFNQVMRRPNNVIEKFLNQRHSPKPLHLLDLVRSSLLTPNLEKNEGNTQPSRLIYCISKLRGAGIELQRREADSFLDVKFRKGKFGKGVIEMPNITMDHHMKSFLVNCLAFEQLHNNSSKHFTVYANFLECLVNTAKDVDYLCDHNIIDNYFGKNGDIVQFINKMGKDLAFDDDQFYLSQLFKDVEECYQNKFNRQVASFKLRYFNTPWSFISAVAALVLLAFTFLQTFYAIYAYVNPKA